MAIYNVDIAEDLRPNDQRAKQYFRAKCRETGDECLSHDPEHRMARLLVERGVLDGEMHTWRGEVHSMIFPSIKRAATRSIVWDKDIGFRSCPWIPYAGRRGLDEDEASDDPRD